MKSKFAGKCKDGCGANWEVGADIFKNDSTEHWCSNSACPNPVTADATKPVRAIVEPKVKITPEAALEECSAFNTKFGGMDAPLFESLAKIYISRMMSNR